LGFSFFHLKTIAMRLIYCLMILLCPFVSIGQMASGLAPLRIGERVPDVEMHTVINASYESTNIAAFDDKLLLLDFWATWCGSCIREFPKLDSLTRRYDRLQVLLVTAAVSSDKPGTVRAFFNKKRNPSGLRYAMAATIDDGRLEQLFPHNSLPHTIWIYKGRLIAITSAAEVNAANIEAVLDGTSIHMETKTDQMDFDPRKPLLVAGNGGEETSVISRSLFTRYLPGAGSPVGQLLTANGTLKRRYFINMPLLRMYAAAYAAVPANRLVLEDGLDTALIAPVQPSAAWKAQHYYCYELTVPLEMREEDMHSRIATDLDAQFGLDSRIEKRKISCYALVVKDSAGGLLTAKDNRRSYGPLRSEAGMWQMYNKSLSALVDPLNRQSPGSALHPVVLDETGMAAPVDLELDIASLQDISLLKKALQHYGLDIIPVTRELPLLVISKTIVHKKTN
jgi:thiol-disulfide isomerase/thioredoxin